jgi:hypothetical protein
MSDKTRKTLGKLTRGMPVDLRGNLVTYLPLDVDRASPDGLSKTYHFLARQYLADAEVLHGHESHESLGKYLLACHALELALKSFLAKNGFSEGRLSKLPFGHDLTALRKEASRLDLHRTQIDTIDHFNKYHYKFEQKSDDPEQPDDLVRLTYALRYEAGPKVLSSCGTLIDVVRAILYKIDPNVQSG